MVGKNFDYISYSKEMKKQVSLRIPKDINVDDGIFICNVIENFVRIAGESISKTNLYTIEQQKYFCQIIAEWTFYKSIDILRADIPQEYWENILQSIAYTVYEVIKQSYERNIEQEQILQAVKYYVNKNFKYSLSELYLKNIIDKTIYSKALSQSYIDNITSENNHNNCYSIENEQYKFLNDSVIVAFARNLTYKYLFKAAHCLKKVSMQTQDRQNILFLLRKGMETVINHIQTEIFSFSIPQVERIVTVSMELLFHRIVVMYKNNILSYNSWSEECVSFLGTIIYTLEFIYTKDNDELKDTYEYTNLFSNKQLKEYLNEYLKSETFTKTQINKAFEKSYIVFLEKELCELMKSKKIPSGIGYWLMLFFILNLTYYYFFIYK